MSKNLNIWIEGTIIAALATVLSLIPFNIGPSFSVTVGAPVMMLYCLRRGLVPGFFASFLWGVLHILIGTAYILTPLQGFIEYFIAFGFTGLAGLFTPKVQQAIADQNQKVLGVASHFRHYRRHGRPLLLAHDRRLLFLGILRP